MVGGDVRGVVVVIVLVVLVVVVVAGGGEVLNDVVSGDGSGSS